MQFNSLQLLTLYLGLEALRRRHIHCRTHRLLKANINKNLPRLIIRGDLQKAIETHLFSAFSYVGPEPVLVKDRSQCQMVRKKCFRASA
jgi:hypothetical protein